MKGEGQKGRQRFSLPDIREEKVKELVALAQARTRAKRYLKGLKQNFPNKRKIELLPVALHQGGSMAAQVLVEEIERQELSQDDRIYLQRFKVQLQEGKTAPA